ncbi:MAG: hypothetical protein K5912_03475 [Alphaproteobacteria bacterium]|nr:hypothetical protein [Alphaproteobacteria bacterium]
MKKILIIASAGFLCLTGCDSNDAVSNCVKRFEKTGINQAEIDSMKLSLKELKKAGYTDAAIKELCDMALAPYDQLKNKIK